MSKTASDCIKEGLELSENDVQAAIKCFDEAIAIDPNCGEAYYQKGFINEDPKLQQEEIELYKKAISLGYVTAQCYYCMGVTLKVLHRDEESIEANKKAIELKSNYWQAYDNMGVCYTRLGKIQEALDAYLNVIKYNQTKIEMWAHIGVMYDTLGQKEEALKNYDIAIEKGSHKGALYKADMMVMDKKFEEAVALYLKALEWGLTLPETYYGLGNAYRGVGNEEEAVKAYTKGTQCSPNNFMEYYAKGQCYTSIGKRQEALEQFRKAQENIHTAVGAFPPYYFKAVKTTLKSIFNAEDVAAETDVAIKKLDQNNPNTKKFVAVVNKLKEQKDAFQNKLMKQLDKDKVEAASKNTGELDRITEELQKKLDEMRAEMQKQVDSLKSEMKVLGDKVQEIENTLADMKQELKQKLDDYDKKLDMELAKQDISVDNQKKIKGYYFAFTQTFSCVHVTAQVIDSGQVKLDAGTFAIDVLSVVASFAPFIGDTLSAGISTVGEFLKSKEMIKNARRMKNLAPDATRLSQIVGQSAYEIAMNKEKQDKIIVVTDEDLQKVSGTLYQKVLKFCENLAEKVDAYLYTDLYSSPSERAGHNDANELIAKYLMGTITPFGAQKQFVKEILDPTPETAKFESSGDVKVKSSCCNMF